MPCVWAPSQVTRWTRPFPSSKIGRDAKDKLLDTGNDEIQTCTVNSAIDERMVAAGDAHRDIILDHARRTNQETQHTVVMRRDLGATERDTDPAQQGLLCLRRVRVGPSEEFAVLIGACNRLARAG